MLNAHLQMRKTSSSKDILTCLSYELPCKHSSNKNTHKNCVKQKKVRQVLNISHELISDKLFSDSFSLNFGRVAEISDQ